MPKAETSALEQQRSTGISAPCIPGLPGLPDSVGTHPPGPPAHDSWLFVEIRWEYRYLARQRTLRIWPRALSLPRPRRLRLCSAWAYRANQPELATYGWP